MSPSGADNTVPWSTLAPEAPNVLAVKPFSLEALREAEGLIITPEILEGREEVSGFVIDPVGSSDHDDAFSITEKSGRTKDGRRFSFYVLSVSIADVAALVRRGSLVDEAATKRAFTRYYGDDGDDPMLPEILSSDRLSLAAGQARPTVTVSIPIGKDISFGEPEVARTVLVGARQLSYPEADEILAGRRKDDSYSPLTRAQYLSGRLAVARGAKYDLKAGIEYGEDGQPHFIRWGEVYKSMVMVREFMLLANGAFALYARNHNIPYLYRAHDDINQRGYYTTNYQGHAGLRLDASHPYSHSTSPIRRLVDVINQRSIFEGAYTEKELGEIAAYINKYVDAYRPLADGTRAGYAKRISEQAVRDTLREGGDLNLLVPRRLARVAAQEGWLEDQRVRAFFLDGLRERKLVSSDIVPILFSQGNDLITGEFIEEILINFPGISREALEAFCGEKGLGSYFKIVGGVIMGDGEEITVDGEKVASKEAPNAVKNLILKLRRNQRFQQLME